jgi:S1-C subfamily serine protease
MKTVVLVLSAIGVAALQTAVQAFAVVPLMQRASPTKATTTFMHLSSTDVAVDLAKLVQPSVALVTPMGVRKMKTRGSGFVVDFPLEEESVTKNKYTHLVTAAHVAAPGFDIGLAFPGDSEDRPATVIGRNQTLDLALLRIDKVEQNLTSLPIAQDLPPVGTLAFAHGYPASRLRGPAMTSGIVCGIADGLGLPDSFDNQKGIAGNTDIGNDSTTFVVTDAAMSGGMSGGPLTDSTGKVLGVNALIRPDLRALGNYAVSSEEVVSFLKSLMEEEDKSANDATTPTSFQLLLFNDRMNKRQRVSDVLKGAANMNGEEANKVMMEAHTTGSGVIRMFQNRTQAEDLCQALRDEDLLVEVQ